MRLAAHEFHIQAFRTCSHGSALEQALRRIDAHYGRAASRARERAIAGTAPYVDDPLARVNLYEVDHPLRRRGELPRCRSYEPSPQSSSMPRG